MKQTHILFPTIVLLIISLFSSCEKIFMPEDEKSDPESVFEYLWKQVDEHYSLFDVKNVDWSTEYSNYRHKVYAKMSDDLLFTVLRSMLNTLDDGHVNLWSGSDVASSETIFLQRYGNGNFDLNTVALTYLRPDHHTTGGMAYNSIANGQVLYIRYGSFSNSASTSQLKKIISRFPNTKGIIFDIRQNGGGEIQNEWNLMQMLPSDGQLLYTTQLKNGPRHNDFGDPVEVRAPSNGDNTPYTKPFVLLTDRGCYSAASSFALCLKSYRNVTVMGDTTAGGLAIPSGGALPNGWYYRFGVSRIIAPDGKNYENGVPPDIVLTLDPACVAIHRDNIIDSASSLILSTSK
ncbi:MAG: S41 family peptidase [Bacteroidales bacterium]|nr:S41 family peptidase [Bacteroidales bacterium]